MYRARQLLFLLSLISSLPQGAWAESPSHSTPLQQEKPEHIVAEMAAQNSAFIADHNHAFFSQHQLAQHPRITVLGCSDSRAPSLVFSQDPTDRVFVVRNIGNQMQNSLGSVDFGVQHLHTPVILVLGHTHCGAVQYALNDYSAQPDSVIGELDHLALPLSSFRTHAHLPSSVFESVWLQAVEANVDYQVGVALKRYEKAVKAGELTVIGGVYDFLNAYAGGEGRLILVNLNGETQIEAMRHHPVVAHIPAPLRGQMIRRLTKPSFF